MEAAAVDAGVAEEAVERGLSVPVECVGSGSGLQEEQGGLLEALGAGRVEGRVPAHAVTRSDVTSGAEEERDSGGVDGDSDVQGRLSHGGRRHVYAVAFLQDNC